MSERGFEVASAYVKLLIEDGDFEEQVVTEIETAVEKGAKAGGEVLVEQLSQAGVEAADETAAPLVEVLGAASEEIGVNLEDAIRQALAMGTEEGDALAQELMDQLSRAGQQGGAGFAGGFEEALAGLRGEVAALQEQLRQTEYQVFTLKNELDFGVDPKDAWAVNKAPAIKEATNATEELTAATGALTEEEIAFGAAFDDVYTRMKDGEFSAEQAMAILAGEELKTTETLSRSLAMVNGSWAQAQASLEQFGTSEAQLAVTTGVLADAEDALVVENTMLLLAYQQLAAGADVSIESLQNALTALADAQASVTSSTEAMVAAQTDVNLAVIQNEVSFADEAAALRDLAAASQLTGMDINELAAEIEAGNFALVNEAASIAQATLKSIALTEAEQQLAAANLTLLGTFERLAAGEEVSAEAQAAALAGVKNAQAEVDGLSGKLDKTAGAAQNAAGGMGLMAQLMYGPLGYALFFIQPFLSALPGLFASSAASAADFTAAVTQDSLAVGDNTAATIQTTLAKSNLSAISNQLSVSQAQLIEYAAGEASVQQLVTDAYNNQVTALNKAAQAQDTYASTTSKNHAGTRGPNMQIIDLEQQKQALDQVTLAVQQAIQQQTANSAALLAAEQTTQIYTAAVNALGQAQLLQVQQTKMTNEATAQFGSQVLFAESSVAFMTSAMNASIASSRESALTTAYTSVSLLNLGQSQSEMNAQLAASETQYTETAGAATAYSTLLTAMDGTEQSLIGNQAAFTTSLATVATSVKTNGDSLDYTNTKGAANVTVLDNIAKQALTTATSIYQVDSQTQNSTTAYNNANNALATMKQQFIDNADKAGLNKNAVQALANELFQMPKDITINADTSPAQSALNDLLVKINHSSATVTVQTTGGGSSVGNVHGATAHYASGGIAQAGELAMFGEEGPELGVPKQDMQIFTASQTKDILGSLTGPRANVTQNFYGPRMPSVEQAADMRRELALTVGGF